MAALSVTAGSMAIDSPICRQFRSGATCALLGLLWATALFAQDDFEWNGHTKLRVLLDTYPASSLFREIAGATAVDVEGDLRLNGGWSRGAWSVDGAYQLFAISGDTVDLGAALPGAPDTLFRRLPDDSRRLLDLTSIIADNGDSVLLHRVDRLTLGYAGERLVLKLGRQALSWGNGLFYAPLDIVNPFDPATVDTEYKAGDDMAYAQLLMANGDDLQVAHVWRRDPQTGRIDADEATFAVKYHGLGDLSEYDALVARNFGATTLAIGGSRSIGGAIWRTDFVVTDADDWTAEFVTNLSTSWQWGGRNVSGALEYYYNGFGQRGGRYSLDEILSDSELASRLVRGQTFAVGRHYLAAGATIEMTPLWLLTPNLFANVDDPSALLQFVTQHSLGDNLTLLAAVNVALGADGTEFGGIAAGGGGGYLARGAGLFVQVAWYF